MCSDQKRLFFGKWDLIGFRGEGEQVEREDRTKVGVSKRSKEVR